MNKIIFLSVILAIVTGCTSTKESNKNVIYLDINIKDQTISWIKPFEEKREKLREATIAPKKEQSIKYNLDFTKENTLYFGTERYVPIGWELPTYSKFEDGKENIMPSPLYGEPTACGVSMSLNVEISKDKYMFKNYTVGNLEGKYDFYGSIKWIIFDEFLGKNCNLETPEFLLKNKLRDFFGYYAKFTTHETRYYLRGGNGDELTIFIDDHHKIVLKIK